MALRTIRLFISSPGDVAEERLIARRLIGRLDAQFSGALQFEAILWERAPLVATASFQEQIVKPSDTDIVIVILWSRLGTPLPPSITRPDGTTYASGTEFEFEDAILAFRREGHPRVLTYFKTAPLTPSGDLASLEEAARQKRAMDRFVTTWFRNDDGTLKGAFHNFAAPADFEDLLEAHLTQLADEFMPKGVAVGGRAPTWHGRSPFRGLQVFEPEHAPVFFGRTAATATVLSKLRAQASAGRAFVLIVSMSGSGKSSLVRAGVLPLLLQPGVVGTATQWRHAVMRPSDGQGNPLVALAHAIADATTAGGSDEPMPDVADTTMVAGDSEAFARLVAERLAVIARATTPSPGELSICHLALVVDQLEEAFSDERIAPSERDAFFAAIDALARSGVVWIVATMRSDAYSLIAESPPLLALKEGDGQFDLLPPNVREIGQIIRLPASAAGLRFETRPSTAEKLDDVIRDAAARNPGALPLLQFLLEELYQRRNDEDVLTFRAYEELGGVEGALAQHAEQVLARVGEDARRALPTVLRELVTFGADDESRALRRIAPRSAFALSAPAELVDALLDARLLVIGSDVDGNAVVSLAHEALIEFWPRMKAWVEEDRELLLVHARLEAATRAWERSGRSGDLLLPRGKPLAEARELATAGIRLTTSESELLTLSQRRAQRFALIRAGAITGLAVLAVVAGIAAWKARIESNRAQVQATTAQRTTDFIVSMFADADPNQSQGDKITVREVLDRSVTQIEDGLRGEDQVRANLLRAMGQAYNGLGLYSTAQGVLTTAVTQSEHGATPEDLFKARLALADNRYQDGDYVTCENLYRAALEYAVASSGDFGDPAALATTGLAECLSKETGKEVEAEARFRSALAINRKVHGGVDLETARDLDGLGSLLFGAGKYAEAEPLFLESLDIRRKLFGPRHTRVAWALNNLGAYYFQTGNYDKAVSTWTEASPIIREVWGPDHSFTAYVLNNLGRVELLTNRLEPAKRDMTEALDIFRRTLSAKHDDLVPPLNSLAMILMAEGDLPKSKLLLDEALAIARERRHPFLNQILTNEAEWAIRSGRPDEARRTLREAREALDAQYGNKLQTSERWRAAVLELTEAAIETNAGDRDSARKRLSTNLPLLDSRFGPNNIYRTRGMEIERKIEQQSRG